jgi:hypothetical protein
MKVKQSGFVMEIAPEEYPWRDKKQNQFVVTINGHFIETKMRVSFEDARLFHIGDHVDFEIDIES